MIEVVPKRCYREGDTPSHLTVLKLPPVAPPRTLPRVAINDACPKGRQSLSTARCDIQWKAVSPFRPGNDSNGRYLGSKGSDQSILKVRRSF